MKKCDCSPKFFVSCQDMGINKDLGVAATAHKNVRRIRSVTSPFLPEANFEIQIFDPKSSQKLKIKMQILENGPKHNQNEISKAKMQRTISIYTLDFCQRAFVGW